MASLCLEQVSLGDIDRAEWDSLVADADGSVFHSHGWLAAYESGAPHQSTPAHLVVRKGGRLVGLLPQYLTTGCPRLAAHRSLLPAQATTLSEPFLLGHSFYGSYGGPLALGDVESIVRLLLDGMNDIARRTDVDAYGFVNVPQTAACVLREVEARGFTVVPLAYTMVLPVRWTTFAEYQAFLPHRWRNAMQRRARHAAEQGLQVEWVARPEPLQEALDLIRGVFVHHGHVNADLYPESYLRSLIKEMGDGLRFLLVRAPDGTLMTTFGALFFNGRLFPWIAGIDYETLKVYESYHFAQAATVQYAISIGATEIDEGRGTYAIKRRYGFTPRAIYLALSSPKPGTREEVSRWSNDLAEVAARRRERASGLAAQLLSKPA